MPFRFVAIVSGAAWLFACSNPKKNSPHVAPDASVAALSSGAAARCAELSKALGVAEVARMCGRGAAMLEARDAMGFSAKCDYRAVDEKGTGPVLLSVTVAERLEPLLEVAKRELAPIAPQPAGVVSRDAVAFFDRARRRHLFVFPVRSVAPGSAPTGASIGAVRVEATSPLCEPGPVARLATTLRQRMQGGR
jgi:hypothetical protein